MPVDNFNQAVGQKKVLCHDRSPFCDYQCQSCGSVMHVHMTQMPPDWADWELRTFCTNCGAELLLPRPQWIGADK